MFVMSMLVGSKLRLVGYGFEVAALAMMFGLRESLPKLAYGQAITIFIYCLFFIGFVLIIAANIPSPLKPKLSRDHVPKDGGQT